MIKKQPMADLPYQEGFEFVAFNQLDQHAYGVVLCNSDGSYRTQSELEFCEMTSWVSWEDWKGAGHHV